MNRRGFLTGIIAVVNTVIGLAVAVPGLRFLLDALWRTRGRSGFVRVAPLSTISRDQPMRVIVRADRWDAYVRYPPGPIGSVWLVRTDQIADDADVTSAPRIRCLQTICPHLSCGVDYVVDRAAFSCPCHVSEFDAGGKRLSGPSPRDMDELECRVTPPDEDGRRWVEVRYQEFQSGTPDKRLVT